MRATASLPRSVPSALVALASGALALAWAGPAAAADAARQVTVPDHGSFRIAFPAAWRCATEPSPEGGGDTFRVEPPVGERFLLLVTPVWVAPENRDARSAAAWMRVRIGGQTVEQDIPIQEHRGRRNTVFWFASSNKAPAAGEHEAMVQGAAMVGELLVGFTLLHHPGKLPERDQVLRALGEAQQLP